MKTIVATHNPDLARDFDRDLLRRNDLRLVTAHTIQGLVAKLLGADICFVDRVLPDGDAKMALSAIRADKRIGPVPVVLVSGQGSPPVGRNEVLAAGFADHVELPADPSALSLIVARLLGLPLRLGERFPVRVHVFDPSVPRGATEESYLGTSMDLSEAGMLLKAKRAVPAGTRLSVRFALPGRAEELSTGVRVVRVDDTAVAPAFALALAFEGLSEADRVALHDYLAALVGGRPFSWQVALDRGRQVVMLRGVLRQSSDISGLRALRGEVWFQLRDFRRIDSDSIQRWLELVRQLEQVTRIRLLECPIAFVQQANLIDNLLERSEIVSLYAPYACPDCGLDEERLIDVERDLKVSAAGTPQPPAMPCSGCGATMIFDELVDQYFAFLSRPGGGAGR